MVGNVLGRNGRRSSVWPSSRGKHVQSREPASQPASPRLRPTPGGIRTKAQRRRGNPAHDFAIFSLPSKCRKTPRRQLIPLSQIWVYKTVSTIPRQVQSCPTALLPPPVRNCPSEPLVSSSLKNHHISER